MQVYKVTQVVDAINQEPFTREHGLFVSIAAIEKRFNLQGLEPGVVKGINNDYYVYTYKPGQLVVSVEEVQQG